MKKLCHIIMVLLAMSAVAACERDIAVSDRVCLYASMMNVPSKGSATDDSGVRDYNYAGSLPVALVRLDENVSAGYPDFLDTGAPVTAVMRAPDSYYRRVLDFDSPQYFLDETSHIRYASWYPSDASYASTPSSSIVTFDIDGATDILYGTVAEGNKSKGLNDILFGHALCQFNIYAYKMNEGTGDDEDIDWGVLQDIEIEKVQKQLRLTLPRSGTDDYEFEFPQESGELKILSLSEGEGIYWNPGDAIPFGFDNKERVATYLAAPPVGGYITLGISTSTRKPYQQVSIARNFKQGCAYDIVLRFTSHGIINAEVSVGEWHYYTPNGGEKIVQDVNADMYYDLSAYRSANSYIVPSGNYGYSFKGDVKGNSLEKIDPGYIDILWCDNPDIWSPERAESDNYVYLAAHTLSKDRIMFKVGDIEDADKSLAHRGNLVVAAYTDASKTNILWTWHLWLNDSVGTIGLNNGYLALNQDLGASGQGTEGLYYQWGRKDPFKIGYFTSSTEAVDIATSVRNPTVFYSSGNSWYSGDIADMKGFWGWERDDKDITKSIYDPCPPGYHVPDYRMWGTSKIANHEVGYVDGVLATVSLGGSQIKFPLSQGYIDDGGSKNTTQPLFMWSSSMDKAGNTPYSFLYPIAGSSPAQTEVHRNYGGAVRCVAKSKPVVKNLSEAQTANTYIISSDGYYKFKATVAGNGVSTLITDMGNEWDMTGKLWGDGAAVLVNFNPDRVDYVWYQPALDSAMPSDPLTCEDVCVKLMNDGEVDANGYVYLEVDGWKPGNVVVAAYKGDIVLWSWLLWLTEKPTDEGNGRYAFHDRNLGATRKGSSSENAESALATYGFHYQWGRKDPFPGSPEAKRTSVALASSVWFEYDKNTAVWTRQTALKTLDGPLDIKTVTHNPQYYVIPLSQSEGGSKRWHWMKGYIEENLFTKALWGYSIEASGTGINPTKTLYDPCPPGYMVPHHWAYWNDPSQLSKGNRTTNTTFQMVGEYGVTCTVFASENYYPLSGRRTYSGNIDNSGYKTFLWGSTPKSGGRTFEVVPNFSKNPVTFTVNGRGGHDWGYDQAYGQSVRCLKL